MQVRPGDATGGAHGADRLAGGDVLSRLHVDPAQVAVHRHQPRTVVEDHRVAVEEIVADVGDLCRSRRLDRRAGRGGDVHAGVRTARLVVEEAAQAVGTRALSRHRLHELQCRGRAIREGVQRLADALLLDLDALEVALREVHLAGGDLEFLHVVRLAGDVKTEALGLAAVIHHQFLATRLGAERDADDDDPAVALAQHHRTGTVERGDGPRIRGRIDRQDDDPARHGRRARKCGGRFVAGRGRRPRQDCQQQRDCERALREPGARLSK